MSGQLSSRFTVGDAATFGKRDAESMVSFPSDYLWNAKGFYEAKIRALEPRLVAIADRTMDRGDSKSSSSFYADKEQMIQQWRDAHYPLYDKQVERIQSEEYDPSVINHEIEQAKQRLEDAKEELRTRKEQWEEVEHGLPQLKGGVKWLIIFLFAVAEIVANLDWLNGLLSEVDSPFPIDPKIFILIVAFVVSLGLLVIGEKAGEDLRQRSYGQMSWKLVALLAAGSTIAYYRDHALAVTAATNAEGDLDRAKVVFDVSRFGVSLAIFVVFSSIALIVGYYSSYSSPEFKTRKRAFEQASAILPDFEEMVTELLERKQAESMGFYDTQMRRIEELKQRLTEQEELEAKRVDRVLEEKHPFGFYKAFGSAQAEVQSIQQEFLMVVSAYVGAYNEVGESTENLPAELTRLMIPERLSVGNPNPSDFRSVPS